MNNIISYLPLLLHGTLVTASAWLVAGFLSTLFGGIIGIVSSDKIGSSYVQTFARIFTFISKGVPAYVQILIAYFVIPSLLGIRLSGFWAACGALAFCSSGYVTEIVRAGVNSVARGQWDAAFVLGYSLPVQLYRVIMPQAIKVILPTYLGELEQLLKSTCLLATIGVSELTRSGMNIISRELNPIPVYLTVAAIYLLFSGILHIISAQINKRNYAYR